MAAGILLTILLSGCAAAHQPTQSAAPPQPAVAPTQPATVPTATEPAQDANSGLPALLKEPKPPLVGADALLTTWPAVGTPGSAVADWDPNQFREVTTDLLIGVPRDGQALEAIGLDGKLRWRVACTGQVQSLVWDDAHRRAVVFTDKQGCLFDPASGARLGNTPEVARSAWVEGFAWHGDLMAFGQPIPPPASMPQSPGYFGTNWTVYHLAAGANGTVRFERLYQVEDGSRDAVLLRDGHTLFSFMGNHGAGRPRLVRDGKLVLNFDTLPAVNFAGSDTFVLDPREDRFYYGDYGGFIQAWRLNGDRLWQVPAEKGARPVLWTGEDGNVRVAARDQTWHSVIYSDQGARLWDVPGWAMWATPRYLVVSQPDRELWLYDRSGKAVMRYPAGSWLTQDGRSVSHLVGKQIELYRLP